MSAEPEYRCPVCRASQTLRETCRRCGADLRLIVRAYQRLAYVKSREANALARGDREQAQAAANERRWITGKGA